MAIAPIVVHGDALNLSPEGRLLRRWARWLKVHDDDGRLPWGAQADGGLRRGDLLGLKGVGRAFEPDSVVVKVGADSPAACHMVWVVFPEVLWQFLLEEPDRPPGWSGTRVDVCGACVPLIRRGLMSPLAGPAGRHSFREFGHSYLLPGIGRHRMVVIDGRIRDWI